MFLHWSSFGLTDISGQSRTFGGLDLLSHDGTLTVGRGLDHVVRAKHLDIAFDSLSLRVLVAFSLVTAITFEPTAKSAVVWVPSACKARSLILSGTAVGSYDLLAVL